MKTMMLFHMNHSRRQAELESTGISVLVTTSEADLFIWYGGHALAWMPMNPRIDRLSYFFFPEEAVTKIISRHYLGWLDRCYVTP